MVSIEKFTLRQARLLADKTQKDAAQHLGVNVRTIHRWETGKAYPTIDMFCELCKFYGIGMNDIDLLCHESKL